MQRTPYHAVAAVMLMAASLPGCAMAQGTFASAAAPAPAAAPARAAAPAPAAPSGPPAASACDGKPVYMVVAGPTRDRARMGAYARAIADSQLYQQLGGYYVNMPAPVAVFEGAPEPSHVTLIVRFPCLANARAFWNSRVYQEQIIPLRQNPSAGDYIVTVYAEAPLREDMVGKVGDNGYRVHFPSDFVEQAPPPPPARPVPKCAAGAGC